MYYGKKKIITIAIIIAIIVIVLIVGGLYVFLGTDLLKPTDVAFWKYAGMEYEKLGVFSNKQYEEITKAQLQVPYETKAKLDIDIEQAQTSLYTLNTQTSKYNVEFNIDLKEDYKKDKQYLNLKASYDNNELLDISYAKSNDIIALKCEEIVLKYFVGIKNENLKDFAKKLGITNTENIPDKIEKIDKYDLISLTQEEKEHILNTYADVINNSIPKSNYTKSSSSILKNGAILNTTAYRLDLNEQELKNISINVLETLKQDSITLNLIVTKAKVLKLEEYNNINSLVSKINELERKIQNAVVDESKGLSIILYEDKNQIIQMELLAKNEFKITIQNDEENGVQKLNITYDNLSENSSYSTISANITKKTVGNENIIKANVNLDNKQDLEIELLNSGSVSNGIYNEITLKTEEEGTKINISYTEDTTFGELEKDIVELSATKNCIVLNNYKEAQIKQILTQIMEETSKVMQKKVQKIAEIYSKTLLSKGNSTTIQNTLDDDYDDLYDEVENIAIESFNAKFSGYKGNITGLQLKTLRDMVSNSNLSSEKKVTLKIDGISYDLVSRDSIKNATSYNVKMEYDSEGYIKTITATSQN